MAGIHDSYKKIIIAGQQAVIRESTEGTEEVFLQFVEAR